MKKLMILGGSEFQIPLVQKAKEMGLYAIVLDINKNCSCKEYADLFYECSIKDYDNVYKIAVESKIDAITVGICDGAVVTAARVCEKLNLPGLTVETAVNCTDKYKMIELFQKNNVPHPRYQYVDNRDIDYKDLNIDFPIIIKPVDMASSKGISLVRESKEFKSQLEYSMCCSNSRRVIIEEYMEGPEVSVELVVINKKPYVIQVTDKITSGAPHFAEIGHTQPSSLPGDVVEQIKMVAIRAAESMNLINSMVHAEIIVTNNGPKMVELGARMGGDGIQEQLVLLSTGISIPEININIALGKEIIPPFKMFDRGSAIRFLQSKEGKIYSIKNQINNPNVYFKIYNKVGDYCNESVDNTGRIGYLICDGNDANDAAEICDNSFKKIDIDIRNEKISDDILLIEPAELNDYDIYYKMKCDPSDIYWNCYLKGPDYESFFEIFKERIWPSDIKINGAKKLFLIKLQDGKTPIGFVLFMNKNNELEIGISILESFQKKGYGTKTIKLATELARRFNNKIFSRIRDDNYASQKIFIKNNFTRTDEYEEIKDSFSNLVKIRKYILNKKNL